MFEFIVSGYVPGTHFQITISWVLLFVAIGLTTYEVVRVLRRHQLALNFGITNILLRTKIPLKGIGRNKTKAEQLELFE